MWRALDKEHVPEEKKGSQKRRGLRSLDDINSTPESSPIPPFIYIAQFKAMVFPVVMYGCESCTIKKAEHQRIDAFELWC